MSKGLLHAQHDYYNVNGQALAEKEITFVGGTPNAIGDFDGTGNPFDIFTVTGTVRMKIYAICTTNLAGAAGTFSSANLQSDNGNVNLRTNSTSGGGVFTTTEGGSIVNTIN